MIGSKKGAENGIRGVEKLKVLLISDTHGECSVEGVRPDVVFILGDLDYYEIKKIDQAYDCPKFGVLGNHDTPHDFQDTEIQNLHGRVVLWNGLRIGGIEGCPRYNNRKYLQYTDDEVEELLEQMGEMDIVLSHSNPMHYLTNDRTDAHRGFLALKQYIREKKPQYVFHGHLHEPSVKKLGDTVIQCIYGETIVEI